MAKYQGAYRDDLDKDDVPEAQEQTQEAVKAAPLTVEEETFKKRYGDLRRHTQDLQKKQADEVAKARAHFVQQEYSKLVSVLPEWNDRESTIKKDVLNYATSVGFRPEEISQLADHRSVLVIKKAMEFDRLTKKVAPKKKAVKKVPKVQKSGRGKSQEDVNSEAVKKKRARLRKSGKQDDAASIFYDML